MNSFKSLLYVIAITACTFSTKAQVSVNSVEGSSTATQPKFIQAISFTPSESTQIENSSFDRALETDNPVNVPDFSGTLSGLETGLIEECGSIQFKYAMMLDVPVETISMTNVYSFVDDWIGTKYRLGGTTKNGVDCSAFAGSLLLGCYALVVPRTAREQHKVATPVEREELKEGDLVFFNTTGGVSHVGVYLANNYFVHSSCSQGVTISSLNDPYYSRRYISAGRIETSDQAYTTKVEPAQN